MGSRRAAGVAGVDRAVALFQLLHEMDAEQCASRFAPEWRYRDQVAPHDGRALRDLQEAAWLESDFAAAVADECAVSWPCRKRDAGEACRHCDEYSAAVSRLSREISDARGVAGEWAADMGLAGALLSDIGKITCGNSQGSLIFRGGGYVQHSMVEERRCGVTVGYRRTCDAPTWAWAIALAWLATRARFRDTPSMFASLKIELPGAAARLAQAEAENAAAEFAIKQHEDARAARSSARAAARQTKTAARRKEELVLMEIGRRVVADPDGFLKEVMNERSI